jgi:hypothetical protein
MYHLFYNLLQHLIYLRGIGIILYYSLQLFVAGFCVSCLNDTDDLKGNWISRSAFAVLGTIYAYQIYYLPTYAKYFMILGIVAFLVISAIVLIINQKNWSHALLGIMAAWGLGLSYAILINLILAITLVWWIPIIAIIVYSFIVHTLF